MYLEIYLVYFVLLRFFLVISQDFAEIPVIPPVHDRAKYQ